MNLIFDTGLENYGDSSEVSVKQANAQIETKPEEKKKEMSESSSSHSI
jgi:hypothetical protein